MECVGSPRRAARAGGDPRAARAGATAGRGGLCTLSCRPAGASWTVLLIWAAARAGGLVLSRAVPIKPLLLGMLAAGVACAMCPAASSTA